jgi:hypothetical protein
VTCQIFFTVRVRSRVGLLANCSSVGLRDQRWGHRGLEVSATTGREIGKGVLLMLPTRGQDGENTLHEATAPFTDRAITGLAPLHGMPQCAFGSIIRFVNWESINDSG